MNETKEGIAALYCRSLAREADNTAYVLRQIGTKEARQHAREAQGAAKIARQWARELEKQHMEKQA